MVRWSHNDNNEGKGVFGQEFAFNAAGFVPNRQRFMNKNFIVNQKKEVWLVYLSVQRYRKYNK